MKIIPLTQGHVALVDDNDYPLLSQHKWCAAKGHNTFYAVRSPKGSKKLEKMHIVLMGYPTGLMVDHRDHNGLNNQKNNLRLATNSQNQANANGWKRVSKFRGVHKDRNKWRARIENNGVKYNLGSFNNREDAAQSYNEKAKELFGDFASLNFITPQSYALEAR